jgi:hypothetical protein
MEKTDSDIKSLGFNEHDVRDILDEFVRHKGRTVTETYYYLLQELKRGNTVETIVFDIEYDILIDILQNECGFEKKDILFILDDFVENQGRSLKETSDYLLEELEKGNTAENIAINIKYNALTKTLQNTYGFTRGELDFIYDIYGYDQNTNKEEIIQLIQRDILHHMLNEDNKNETILKLKKVRDKYKDTISNMTKQNSFPSQIVKILMLNNNHAAAAAAGGGIKKKTKKANKANKANKTKKAKRRRSK